jgi:tRNA(fMet)-specific endonuclease VapC
MPGYLLDTNHISAWEEANEKFVARLRSTPPENIMWVCPISLGELECGMRITQASDERRRHDCRQFINAEVLNFVRPIGPTTTDSYALVMERIWHRYPPASGRIATQTHLSSKSVDVNDVWIAAVALEHGLILLTADHMDVIQECVPELQFDNWLI